MKPLNLSDAMKLGVILYPYIPDEAEDGLDFVSIIVNNIKNSGNHRDYLEATSMLCDFPVEALIELDNAQFVLETFTDGVLSNNLLDLKVFFDSVGFNNG